MKKSNDTRKMVCLHCSKTIYVDKFFNALSNSENTLSSNEFCPHCGYDMIDYLLFLRSYEYWYERHFKKENNAE